MPWLIRQWLARLWRPLPLGLRGERVAERFLRRSGFRILARGKHLDPGELDLVALDGATLVFVEVKTRQSGDRGHPADAVDLAKQRRLTRLAVTWLKQHQMLDRPARFDVVAITWPPNGGRPAVEHVRDAFAAEGRWEFYS